MNKLKNQPSKITRWFLKLIIDNCDHDSLIGDFEEMYQIYYQENGRLKAELWLWSQIVKSIPSFIVNSIIWSFFMFKNYLKIALRNMKRQKGISFINIAGLATGMTCSILIMLWVQDELSYDRFNENADDLYRVVENQHFSEHVHRTPSTPGPLAAELRKQFAEIIDAARFANIHEMLIRYGEKSFFETRIAMTAPAFLRMFTFPFLKGDKNTALNEPYSIVITAEIAEKYFGHENPIGKVLSINNKDDYTVTGVIKNVPHNSHLQFDMLVPFDYMEEYARYAKSWGNNQFRTYVLLAPNTSEREINPKIADLVKKHVAESNVELSLQPVKRIHLYSDFGTKGAPGDIIYVVIFSMIAIFILLIACINFMNLSTARSASREKEIAVRKVVGAFRINIVHQFFSESVLMSILALLLALGCTALILPWFNVLSGKQLSLNILGNWKILTGVISITLCVGLVSGSYPALFMSSFHPINVLKSASKSSQKSAKLRKVLVVVQFALSIILIIATGIVCTQLDYIQNMRLGFDKEQLLTIRMNEDLGRSYNVLKNELKKDSRILGVTASWSSPASFGSTTSNVNWPGKNPDEKIMMTINFTDVDFIETLNIEMKEGRSFSKEFSTETSASYIINEELVKIMDVESAVNADFTVWGKLGKIIGVVKNFHFQSVHSEIKPLILGMRSDLLEYILIRVGPDNIALALTAIEKTWKNVFPGYPFEYKFLDAEFDEMYSVEQRMGTLLNYFSVLAVFIACLGLFGLISFSAEQKTKEIGIRKILGSSVSGMVIFLSKDLIKLVLISNVIAWPVAWFAMRSWLQNFVYRTDMEVTTFILAGALALMIAMLTLCFQAIKAATANPVDSLKYE